MAAHGVFPRAAHAALAKGDFEPFERGGRDLLAHQWLRIHVRYHS